MDKTSKTLQTKCDKNTAVEQKIGKLIIDGKFEEANYLINSLKKKELVEKLKELLDRKIKEVRRVTVTHCVWLCYGYLKEQNEYAMPLEIIEYIDHLHEQGKIYGS